MNDWRTIAVCAPTHEAFLRWVSANKPGQLLKSNRNEARCDGWRVVHIRRPEDFLGSSFDAVVLLRDWSAGIETKRPGGARDLLQELEYRLR